MGDEARERTLRLIDFLADYDARKNPPVRDITRFGMFVLRDGDVPAATGVHLQPAEGTWLAVDFLDLPPQPRVPDDLAELIQLPAESDPFGEAQLAPALSLDDDTTSDSPNADPSDHLAVDEEALLAVEELRATAQEWIDQNWNPWATEAAQVARVKALHGDVP